MPKTKNPVSKARSENMRAIRSFGNRTTELRLKAILVRRSITGWKLFSSMDAFSTVVRAAATLRGLTEPIGQQK
jgi:hypothetical protein